MTSTEGRADEPGVESAAADRNARMTGQVKSLRTRASAGRFDRWLLIVGSLLMPLGIVLILLGWAGTSRTSLVYEQVNYVMSGGLLGLALVTAGGFTYFAYWQTLRVREARKQTTELTNAIMRLEALVGRGAMVGVGQASVAFVATAHGSIFHRPDCAAVLGRDDLSAVDPDSTTLRPCRICNPLDPA
jgi:hypothetical protein